MAKARCSNCCQEFERTGLAVFKNFRHWHPRCDRCEDPLQAKVRREKYQVPDPIPGVPGPPRQATEEIREAFLEPSRRYRTMQRVLWWVSVPLVGVAALLCTPLALAWPLGGWDMQPAEVHVGELDESGRADVVVRLVDEDGDAVETTLRWHESELAPFQPGTDTTAEVAYLDWPPDQVFLLEHGGTTFAGHFFHLLLLWLGLVAGTYLMHLLANATEWYERRRALQRIRIFETGIIEVAEWWSGHATGGTTHYSVRCSGWGTVRRFWAPYDSGDVVGGRIMVCYLPHPSRQCIVLPGKVIDILYREHIEPIQEREEAERERAGVPPPQPLSDNELNKILPPPRKLPAAVEAFFFDPVRRFRVGCRRASWVTAGLGLALGAAMVFSGRSQEDPAGMWVAVGSLGALLAMIYAGMWIAARNKRRGAERSVEILRVGTLELALKAGALVTHQDGSSLVAVACASWDGTRFCRVGRNDEFWNLDGRTVVCHKPGESDEHSFILVPFDVGRLLFGAASPGDVELGDRDVDDEFSDPGVGSAREPGTHAPKVSTLVID